MFAFASTGAVEDEQYPAIAVLFNQIYSLGNLILMLNFLNIIIDD